MQDEPAADEESGRKFLRASPLIGGALVALGLLLCVVPVVGELGPMLMCFGVAMLILRVAVFLAKRSLRRVMAAIVLSACLFGFAAEVMNSPAFPWSDTLSLGPFCALLLAVVVRPELSYRGPENPLARALKKLRLSSSTVMNALILLLTPFLISYYAYLLFTVTPFDYSNLIYLALWLNLAAGAVYELRSRQPG